MKREKKNKIEAILEKDRKNINLVLKGYLDRQKGPKILRKAIAYSVFSGGKRLRPVLTLESFRIFNRDIRKAVPFACAVELVHNFSLVHDDLPAMDNDNFRRGKPTCHRKFGEGIAILTGDALLNLAFEVISKTKQSNSLEIISLLCKAIGTENMAGGQALDLRGTPRKENIALKRRINRMKTGGLMAASCEIGAVLAEADKQNAKRLQNFGLNMGLAFQVADDMEDADGNKSNFKKMMEEVKI